ncbi:pentatricopeptide repeat-containing protein At2g27800, mitochondrial-like [Chenopodium quinoa]|uniref:pentatricopeptide repeat-containing protein At2g27800, mitochondrial-like n=1 Tax=Chenopodium quinoa TaxID=63459 RepID=UPI000B784640|nr:pentatricopeptide repeat-containing protein At2g27800, mitochondrial-like [Chenopodium quinoa]
MFFNSIQRFYKYGRSKCLTWCFHQLCSSRLVSPHEVINARIGCSNFSPAFTIYSHYSQINRTSLLWYSSKPHRPFSGAYRQRVNRRLRPARKPVLNEVKFNKAVSQLPARFNADDLHGAIALEDDPLVCLELFNWASKQHRFKHSVNTYHITVQKLGVGGMIEEMYDVVDQFLALPHFGSEALYNTIIYYYTQARKLSRAITVFKHMKKAKDSDCRPSMRTYNLLFAAFLSRRRDTYINHWYMGTMECLFKQMINDKIEPDIFALNSMIQGYVLSNHVNEALRIFHQMGVVYTCVPNALTYDYLIYGLCAQTRTKNARELFFQMKEKGFVASAKTYNSLVSSLALGGEIEEALSYLWEMTEKHKVDLITYKTLLDEYCRKGRAEEAFRLLKEFQEKHIVDGPTYKKLLCVLKEDFAHSRNGFQ